MQKSIIIKKKLININMKDIFTVFSKKQRHLKSLLQIFFFFSIIMCNTKQIIMCIKLIKQMIN